MNLFKWNYCPSCAGLLNEVAGQPTSRQCARCSEQFWDSPVPVVAVVVETPEGVVMAHNRAWPPKMLAPITGFIEACEEPLDAAKRELKEELGLDANSVEWLGTFSFPAENQLIIAFHVRASGTLVLGDELDEVRVIAPDKLKAWPFGTGLAIAEFLRRRGA